MAMVGGTDVNVCLREAQKAEVMEEVARGAAKVVAFTPALGEDMQRAWVSRGDMHQARVSRGGNPGSVDLVLRILRKVSGCSLIFD